MLPEHHPRYPSPAKLNLDLRITGRLPNGYHALESIFTLIDLQDTLCIVPRDDGQIVLQTPTPNVPDEQNLVVRAAKSLRDKAATPEHGADIWLEKRIPMGGGLGGGSSNAATVLMVLNDLWQCGLNTAQLLELALPLGRMCPFSFSGGRHLRAAWESSCNPLMCRNNIMCWYGRMSMCPRPPFSHIPICRATVSAIRIRPTKICNPCAMICKPLF